MVANVCCAWDYRCAAQCMIPSQLLREFSITEGERRAEGYQPIW
jgi:hypothetical protein